MRKILLTLGLLACLTVARGQQEDYFIKKVEFPANATLEQKLDMTSRLVPSESQYAWQQLELTAFIHFGINTFTGREWGDGKEDPVLFNPVQLDAEQWVKALRDGGFKMVILTAKHHDGFCLWPTATTSHSVVSSPWKSGKGDVVKELKNACDKFGMKFGVYLSPWDRNAECYGDSPRYNRMFVEQLKELLGNYGKIHEIWFDGANAEGPNGKKQVYDWKMFYSVMDSLQPGAVRAIMGDDIRWVGNEKGLGRETEWSVTALVSGIYEHAKDENERMGLYEQSSDLGGRDVVTQAQCMYWYPSEVDVSIRPGWFYHAQQDDQVKSLPELVDIYFRSVGYNSVLLLNIPPDKRGLLHGNDVQRLKELGDYLKKTFADNKLDGGDKTCDLVAGEFYDYMVKPGETFNTFMLQEDITRGQRIEEFKLEAYYGGKWYELAKGTTVGYKRLVRFPEMQAEKIRLTIPACRNTAHIGNAGAFYAEPLEEEEREVPISDIPVKDWKVIAFDSEKESHPAKQAIDGNATTYWKSGDSESKHAIDVDMGTLHTLKGFSYAPVAGNDITGTVYRYRFYVSTDNENWTECECSGEFSNIMHNPVPQFVRFAKDYPARYFRFEPVQEIDGRPFVTVGEIGVQIE